MDFACNKSFWKDEPLTSWKLLQHICPHFWAWLLNAIAITPKSEDKYVFNSSEFHLSEITCSKIHTLESNSIFCATNINKNRICISNLRKSHLDEIDDDRNSIRNPTFFYAWSFEKWQLLIWLIFCCFDILTRQLAIDSVEG